VLINIHQINSVKKSYIALEGTILIFHEENGFRRSIQSELHIPLELISVYERFRFKGSHLIASLLSLLAPMLIFGILYGITFEMMRVDEESIYKDIFTALFLILLLAGFIMFWIFLIKFFVRGKTVCLIIAPDEINIEFWKEKKNSAEIDELLMQIEHRKEIVEETLMQPYKKMVGFLEERSLLPKLFFLIYLFSLPAIIMRKLSLIYLLLLPVAWFLYREIEFRKQPKEYRKALKSYFNEEWDQAINLLKSLRIKIPEYIPAYILLVNVYTRANRFDEALGIASELPDEYIDIAQDIQTDIWAYKRIYKRRKDNLMEVN
jgi:hypothetical protein